ncbi:Pre-mRNA-splicing factor of RES complex-domain-containing protein [Kockovaella imperatae]|uniref:Pre-mRNA-splicing factor of RES complex-domain-containing protein n=1 Tax=Kockovaella imperatae TaxID=4999 RepID=A0A1Y1UPK2_9TREE|nr:Pre-mRNA-splicing factor of RES complex-domain-containing protein [Kockovaella imperatae]ORX39961.1 Pre-mRNA-splicing factor of RES complex-domain-containing protein [Kockovaella imperatae]
MSDLKTYLASRYMSGPKADAILARSTDPSVKKKRKKIKNEDYIGGSSVRPGESSSGAIVASGLGIRDEDEWRTRDDDEIDFDGEDAPVLGKDIATFKKSKNQWATVGASTIPVAGPSRTNGTSGDDSMTEVKQEPMDEPGTATAAAALPAVQMTKRRGGLRTAAQLREEEEALQAAERSPSPIDEKPGESSSGAGARPDPTQTIHRDASGRIIDVEKLKEEEKKRVEEEKRKEREKEEWTKGMTQRKEREERAREELEMRDKDVSRFADDAKMNKELKEVERWNDPASEFLTKKKKKQKGPRRPKCQFSMIPNRFNIAPGFRWDGVDRSNGFEKKFFQYQNAAARRTYESNQWSMEDM